MIVSSVQWKDFNAVKITNRLCELIISLSVGPRIVSLKYHESENLLYEDFTGFGVNEWLLYGGHRFTIAPESAASYYPDNADCIMETTNDSVTISAPIRPDQLQLSIRIVADDNGFDLTHILANHGTVSWSGALWAITCIPRTSVVHASCKTSDIHYWPGTDSACWFVADDSMQLKPGDFRGKTGWHQRGGWLAARRDNITLKIKNLDETSPGDCVDNGCNLEMFACKHWIELETLGPLVTVQPGSSRNHDQSWRVSDGTVFSQLT